MQENRTGRRMLQNAATTEANYEKFIERILVSRKVWGIEHANGTWATSSSNEDEDRMIYVFFSHKAYAKRHCREAWSNSKPSVIKLDDFIDNWLKGMHEDGHLVGPNWDANFCGKEVEPIELAQKLAQLIN